MMRSRWISCGIASAILVVALTLSAHAVTIHVPDDQPTIQAGIDAAAYGDTVLVACGTYYEHDIDMKSGVTLTGETGQADCVTIDAQQYGNWARVIDCVDLDSSTTIQGFTVTGGYIPFGGAMRCRNSSLTIRNVVVSRNFSDFGGGLWSRDSFLTLQNVSFLDNEGYMRGGGVFSESSSLTLEDVLFLGNDQEGMYSADGLIALTDCSFVGNAADGIYCEDAFLSGTGCEFTGNAGRGIILENNYPESTACTLTSCRFVDNAKGGVSSQGNWGATLAFAECSFVGNMSDGWGGGLFAGSCDEVSLTGCTFAGNTAEVGGAAAFSHCATDPVFVGCTIVGNEAATGGAVCCAGLIWGWGNAMVTNTIIAFNTGDDPLAFYLSSEDLCNVIYGNEGGESWWCGYSICEDPLLCGDLNPDAPYMLRSDSPCAPENNPVCGQIGAWGVGCEAVTPVQGTSWGAIKGMYR